MQNIKTKNGSPPRSQSASLSPEIALRKAPTGITGFDAITRGGLPAGRPTLLCGGPGCGKTIFAIEFLVHGAEQFDEPGVFVAFEETQTDLAENVASLGYDLQRLIAEQRLAVDHIHVDPSEIEEAGSYTLDGLFVRLDLAVRNVKAKRIVIDSLEVLFARLKDDATVRGELQRLFRWLKERDLTAIITAERGEPGLTRQGLEEYVSDCVVLLDQRVDDLVTTRLLRVVKYRGSSHGADEYPFLIDEGGLSVLPMTSVQLDYEVSTERVSTGVPDLDQMLGGEGYFRTSTILVSGAAGTGKSSLTAHMVDAACARGERVIIFALEESPSQIVRNMRSLGIDLEKWRANGLLVIHATRSSLYGIEMHLLQMNKAIDDFKPRLVILDPISSLTSAGSARDVKSMMVRLFDSLKMRQITGFVTYLTASARMVGTEAGISSLIDTWLELRDVEMNGERTRGLYVIKSRGMPHSNQVREFVLQSGGIRLLDVYPGPEGILTGSSRAMQDIRFADEDQQRQAAAVRSEELLARKHAALQAQLAGLVADFASEAAAIRLDVTDANTRAERERSERTAAVNTRSRFQAPDASPESKER
jgi:circadian clock protein KaiC